MLWPRLPPCWIAPGAPVGGDLALAGFGAGVTGGGASPSLTYNVTNTNASGAGSLPQAILDANAASSGATKLINITASGRLDASGPMSLTTSNCTITAANAGGSGFQLGGTNSWNSNLLIAGGSNNLVEHLRLYRGTPSIGDQARCILPSGGPNAVRHCDLMFSEDGLATITGIVTFQYCLWALPLHNNHHDEGGGLVAHGYGPDMASGAPNGRVTFHCCAFAHFADRMMLRLGGGKAEFVSCVAYNWGNDNQATVLSLGTESNYRGILWMGGNEAAAASEPMALAADARASGTIHLHISSDCIWQQPDFSQTTGWTCIAGGQQDEGSNTEIDIGVTVPCEKLAMGGLWGHLEPRVGAVLPQRSWVAQQVIDDIDGAANQNGHSGTVIDSVFRSGDPNTNPARNDADAPLADFNGGAGWGEALTGP